MNRHLLILLVVFLILPCPATAGESGGEGMPEILTVRGRVLVLNGIGERVAFTRTIYEAGLYLEEPEKQWREVVERDDPMAVRMHVTNSFLASSSRLRDDFFKGFRSNAPGGGIRPIQEQAEAFIECFQGEIRDQDVFLIAYLPGEGTRVSKNGELQALIPGYDFKQALFGIWVGKAPLQESLKAAMLRADVSEAALALRKEKIAELEKKGRESPGAASESRPPAGASGRNSSSAADPASAPGQEAAPDAGEAVEKAETETISLERFEGEDIYFPVGEDLLGGKARRRLERKASWLRAHPEARVVIEGHADSRGPKAANRALARSRAQQVKAYLSRAGIAENRMTVKSYGEDRPTARGENPAAWSRNRRVHLRIIR
jgi:outer membrane protein OmpA-like peptidoglycan-associated protein